MNFEVASCRGATDLFYDREREAEAKAICAGCPVRVECLELGLREKIGIWGGLSAGQRSHLRRRRHRVDPDVERVCGECGASFTVPRKAGNRPGFCSELCRVRSARRWSARHEEKRRKGQVQVKRRAHGTISSYHAGCRCGACRAKGNAVRRDARLAAKSRANLVQADLHQGVQAG